MKEKDIITIDITSINSEGEGVGRVGEGFVVFVPETLPGERVKCRVGRVGKSFASAAAEEVISASPHRVAPKCPSYGKCGGCQLQHASYETQLEIKGHILTDAMERIGHIALTRKPECVPSALEWGYRGKTVMPAGKRCGYYEKRSHRIVEFAGCPVLEASVERVIGEMITAFGSAGLKGYDERKGRGDVRGLAARGGLDGILVGTITAHELSNREFGRLRDLHQKMMPDFGVSGSVLSVKTAPGNFVWGSSFKTVCGNPMATERLGRFDFGVDVSAFFQVNAPQAERIFSRAAEEAARFGASRALELYAGVGSLTAYIAGTAGSVDAVEDWRPAARLMKENMERNGIGNVRSFGGSAENFLSDRANGGYDVIVMDPPRTGASEDVIRGILRIAPRAVIYVSCNPATLARDAEWLVKGGYGVSALEVYDMFPQTAHVESLCVLTRE